MVDRSNNDIPFEVAVSSFCSCTYNETPCSRQVSKNPTSSTRDSPIRSMDQISTVSIAPIGSPRSAPIRLGGDLDPFSPSSAGR